MNSDKNISAGERPVRRSVDAAPSSELNPLALLTSGIDRNLPISINVQLCGVIEYGIMMGSLPAGVRLPTVRELADEAGIATMTVVGVYNKLKKEGMIETRGKAGTFVSDVVPLPRRESVSDLGNAIDKLLQIGRELGLDARRIADMIEVRSKIRNSQSLPSLRILLVGLFKNATVDYGRQIRDILNETDSFDTTTLGELQSKAVLPDVDFVMTLANRRAEVQALFSDSVHVAGINFIPSFDTRTRLAGLDPTSRVGIVSTFPEFVPLMKPNVLRFIPHVASAEITVVDDPELKGFVRQVDIVVYASGAERVLSLVSDGQMALEYRHMPDLNGIRSGILPLLEELRKTKATMGQVI